MRRPPLSVLISLLIGLPAFPQSAWKVVWSDEFNGPANSLPDSSKWAYDLGGGGWGNAELQVYTNSVENAHLNGNGSLVIRAIKTPQGGYTSARLKTLGKYTPTYGKIEARLKVPFGQGIWPAFWMLGTDIGSVGWPACGEIDIMENIGREPSIVHASVHGPGYSGANPITASFTLSGGRKLSDDFHLFSVVWNADSMEFAIDGQPYLKVTPASLPPGASWVFRKPFYILLNVAVGGRWPGYPDATTVFPQEMTVDYVRVYEPAETPAINPKGVVNGASFGPALAPGSLASIFGQELAAGTNNNLFDPSQGAFRNIAEEAQVAVNGVISPLTYVSPRQINFQLPWETPIAIPVPVQVIRGDTISSPELVALDEAAPSAFGVAGTAILTCEGGSPKPDVYCTLWGNGFGPLEPPQQNGVPSSLDPLPLTTEQCKLSVGGVDATVTYCGGAPGLVIAQLNFLYPPGVPDTGAPVPATLTIGTHSGSLQFPPQ